MKILNSPINEFIQTLNELEDLSKILQSQGFGHLDTQRMHRNKINEIYSKCNTLNLKTKEPTDLLQELSGYSYWNVESYEEVKNYFTSHFAKFSTDDLIKQYYKENRVLRSRFDNLFKSDSQNKKQEQFEAFSKCKIKNFTLEKVEDLDKFHGLEIYTFAKKYLHFHVRNWSYFSKLLIHFGLITEPFQIPTEDGNLYQITSDFGIRIYKGDKVYIYHSNLGPLTDFIEDIIIFNAKDYKETLIGIKR